MTQTVTFAIFAIVQKLSLKPSRLLTTLAGATFGIYLRHYTWVFITFDWFNIAGLSYVVRIIAMTISTFVIAAMISYILGMIPFTRRFVK